MLGELIIVIVHDKLIETRVPLVMISRVFIFTSATSCSYINKNNIKTLFQLMFHSISYYAHLLNISNHLGR